MKRLAVILFLVGGLAAYAQLVNLQAPNQGGGLHNLIISQPTAVAYDDVADATARLSLLGISTGKRVHQVDNNTVYQYNGPSTSAAAGMIVAGTATADGIYGLDGVFNGKNGYSSPPGVGATSISWIANLWQITGDTTDTSASNVATPNLATWTGGVTVTIDHIAGAANWSVVP